LQVTAALLSNVPAARQEKPSLSLEETWSLPNAEPGNNLEEERFSKLQEHETRIKKVR